MKNTMIILALSLGIGSAYSQKIKEAEVPPEVKDAFKKAYPKAEIEKWEKEDGNYEAEFEIERIPMDKSGKKEEIEHSAVYTPKGELVQTEEEIKVSDLPKAVSEYIEKNVGKKISEASKITDAKGVVNYEAEAGGTDYIFDAEGKFLKKEADNEKDDDKKKK
jgi:hypothetical protein